MERRTDERGREERSATGNAGRLRITQIRSVIGGKQNQRDTLRTLGLNKIRDAVTREDGPAVRGMIATVSHLVAVEEVE